MSAVSRKVTPSSSARWIVAIASASSRAAVELGHPHAAEPERGDLEPLLPSLRISIVRRYPRTGASRSANSGQATEGEQDVSHTCTRARRGALCTAGLGRAADAEAAELFYGVDAANRLVTFSGQTPTSIKRIPFTGLAAEEQVVGLDVRPANKQVVALGSTSRLYRIDVATGVATAIGTTAFVPGLAGASFGFDFNPTVDRIRVTTDARPNVRLHPDTGATAAVDGQLSYAAGDAGASSTPRIVASAYTNSVAGATTTQLFDLDAGRDALALQNPPNNGTLVTVGSLGIDIGDNAGFDISAVDGIAYAAVQVGQSSSSQLYSVNLGTGAATLVGRIGGGSPLRALAAVGTAPADTAAPGVTLAKAAASTKLGTLLRTGARLRATCSEGCMLSAQILSGPAWSAAASRSRRTSQGRLRFGSSSARRRRRSSVRARPSPSRSSSRLATRPATPRPRVRRCAQPGRQPRCSAGASEWGAR